MTTTTGPVLTAVGGDSDRTVVCEKTLSLPLQRDVLSPARRTRLLKMGVTRGCASRHPLAPLAVPRNLRWTL